MVLAIVLGMAACGKDEKKEPDTAKIDMSKYPADVNEWSGQNLIDYFVEAGVFTGTQSGDETWLQDHEYWTGMPVSECAGYWTGDSTVMIMMLLLDDSQADSSKEAYDEWMTSIKEKKTLPGEMNMYIVDHLVGNIAFIYSTITMDDGAYNAMEQAYQDWVKALNVTPEF